MILYLSNKLTTFLLQKKIINSEFKELYCFGFQTMISNIIGTLLALLVVLVTKKYIETLCYFVIFITFRKFCGGYHADTHLMCNTIFFITTLCTVLAISFIQDIPVAVEFLCYVFCLDVLLIFAPLQNKNKPIELKDRRKFKLYSLAFMNILFIICGIINKYFSDLYIISTTITITIFVICVHMIMGRIKETLHS